MKNLKKYLLLILLCLPMLMQAQVESKYLEGAVPEVNGKVTFTASIEAKGKSRMEIYETVLKWAKNKFHPKENLTPKVLYANQEKAEIAVGGEDYIVFTHNYLVLDRTRIYYHLIANCEDEKCNLTMTRIHYWYEEEVDGGYKYKAEKWITDKEALNKAKNKLAKVSGKFRQKTIDYKDNMFSEIQTALNGQAITTMNEKVSVIQEPEAAKETVATKTENRETIIQNAVRMTVTAGSDEQFEINKESWGGLGNVSGKTVAFCLIDTQKTIVNMLMVQNDTYKITFYNANNHPVLTINCKKLKSQNINGKEAQKMNSNCAAGKSYNMYVGEIIE